MTHYSSNESNDSLGFWATLLLFILSLPRVTSSVSGTVLKGALHIYNVMQRPWPQTGPWNLSPTPVDTVHVEIESRQFPTPSIKLEVIKMRTRWWSTGWWFPVLVRGLFHNRAFSTPTLLLESKTVWVVKTTGVPYLHLSDSHLWWCSSLLCVL